MNCSRTRIKVCGLTTAEDAQQAITAGVDALGFIFAENSPRAITPEKAREIISQLPPFVNITGVFVDQDPVEIEEIIEYCGLNYVQLHGQEDAEYCVRLGQSASPCRLLKAFRVGPRSMASDFRPYETCVSGFLLDTYVVGQEGGTGQVFDWSIIASLKLTLPVILAGGLNPANVAAAISEVRPFAIDVNSGVESEPGRKDIDKLKELVTAVRQADGS